MTSVWFDRRTFTPAVIVAGGLFAVAGALVVAGPLDPPPGPVAPTFKTLGEVEPRIAINDANTPGDADSRFRISAPGSYYLTSNITGVPGKHGIEIAASGVTLDLNGFELAGVPAMGALDGVTAALSNPKNIAVINGSIRGWGDEGVDLQRSTGSNCRVERVFASGNAGVGIAVGSGGVITNCSAFQNSTNGISVSDSGTISNCVANFNTGVGVLASVGCVITGCSATGNGSVGIEADEKSTITNCAATGNILGIYTENDCTITDCTVTGSVSVGISTGSRSSIIKSTVTDTSSGPGVASGFAGLRIEGSTISGNSTFGVSVNTTSNIAELVIVGCTISGNGSTGVTSEASTQVLDSFISSNGGAGISVTSSSLIRGCTVNTNALSGIDLLTNANVVMNNTLSTNNTGAIATTAGILVGGGDNTIDGNRLFANAQGGIKLNGTGNLVLRNYLANSGATITGAAGNAVAQTLAPGAGFISTDPNANLLY